MLLIVAKMYDVPYRVLLARTNFVGCLLFGLRRADFIAHLMDRRNWAHFHEPLMAHLGI